MTRKAIIVDLDHTLCDNSHRRGYLDAAHKDWDTINRLAAFDMPIEWCLELCRLYGAAGYAVLFVTARSGSPIGLNVTREWLQRNVGFNYDWHLFMRKDGDARPDYVVKQELYNEFIAGQFDVHLCVDDRQDVCDMWRNLGLNALQCAN